MEEPLETALKIPDLPAEIRPQIQILDSQLCPSLFGPTGPSGETQDAFSKVVSFDSLQT
jgi:hypothetical protein